LSDILESGKSSDELYGAVAAILQQKSIQRFIGIGPEIFKLQHLFKNIPQCFFFSSIADCLQQFYSIHFHNETILLKGARVFEFEQISHLLEEKLHQTVLEINLNAVTHNLKAYQQLLKPGVKMMAMVKAFSYGSGGFEIANLLQLNQIDYLAVAYVDEGVELRRAGINLPILVLNPEEVTFDILVKYQLEPEIYSFGILNGFQNYLEKGQTVVLFPQGTRVPVGGSVEKYPYQAGVTALYLACGVPVIPAALNSGKFWPKSGLGKKSGKIIFKVLNMIKNLRQLINNIFQIVYHQILLKLILKK
jgi:alanine racemase